MPKLLLYFHTLRYLKPIQIYYRVYYFIRNKLVKPKLSLPSGKATFHYIFLASMRGIDSPVSYQNGSFTFLNQTSIIFLPSLQGLNWNFDAYGKLWNYNLNYFDYLLQPDMLRETGLELIEDFIDKSELHTHGLDPFPTSLRIVNWIKFISYHSIDNQVITESLHDQCNLLLKSVEYHLLGNHVLENGFALIIAGLFFNEPSFYEKGKQILVTQLNEQILDDGGHFELSPMYHEIILNRVLDVINILQHTIETDQKLRYFLEKKVTRMIFWIKEMTFSSGMIPLFNDCTRSIAPDIQKLIDYAIRLGIPLQKPENYKLSDSGYRRYSSHRYEIILDVGQVGPMYIPGHAHADMLSFEIESRGMPFIVDTGTSTYEIGKQRKFERSTSAHNTIQIGNNDQSEMWASHRIGRRARIKILKEEVTSVTAKVHGYFPLLAAVSRTFSFYPHKIILSEKIIKPKNEVCYAFFHFHPDVKIKLNLSSVSTNIGSVSFSGHQGFELIEYFYAPEFNVRIPSLCLKISFLNELISTIEF